MLSVEIPLKIRLHSEKIGYLALPPQMKWNQAGRVGKVQGLPELAGSRHHDFR